jgi:hypothetical protein
MGHRKITKDLLVHPQNTKYKISIFSPVPATDPAMVPGNSEQVPENSENNCKHRMAVRTLFKGC